MNKFGAHILFAEEMTERLNLVPNSNWKEHMYNALKKLIVGLETFASLKPDLQTIEAKKLMKEMVLIFEGVVALEWGERHGGRYEKIMQIFIETNWGEREVGDEKSSVKYFNQII